MHLGRKSNFFFLQIKKYQKLNEIFKIQETKLWKVSLKSVCISRQCSFISKKKRRGLERWEREEEAGAFRGRFDFDFLHFLAHFSSGSQFLSGRHIEQSIPDIFAARREKRTYVSRVVSSPVHTDNWVVRESFIVQGARLFIPFHSISLHRIPSFDRKRRENDGSQIPPTFFLLFYSHIFIYFLLVYFFFVSIYDLSWQFSSRTPLVDPSNQETPT